MTVGLLVRVSNSRRLRCYDERIQIVVPIRKWDRLRDFSENTSAQTIRRQRPEEGFISR